MVHIVETTADARLREQHFRGERVVGMLENICMSMISRHLKFSTQYMFCFAVSLAHGLKNLSILAP